jgi:hypothetical protein
MFCRVSVVLVIANDAEDGIYILVVSVVTGVPHAQFVSYDVCNLYCMFILIICPGLEFLPTGEDSAACRGFSDASVVSISVDHQVSVVNVSVDHQVR